MNHEMRAMIPGERDEYNQRRSANFFSVLHAALNYVRSNQALGFDSERLSEMKPIDQEKQKLCMTYSHIHATQKKKHKNPWAKWTCKWALRNAPGFAGNSHN